MIRKRYKILIADESEIGRQLGDSLLERSAFIVLTAKDGLEALERARSERPSLVIIDQGAPGLSGAELCAKLRSGNHAAEIPVIVLAEIDGEDLRHSCTLAGVTELVLRSSGRDHLLATIARVLHIPLRRPVRLTVFFSVENADSSKEALGKAVNLCAGGMGLEVDRPYQVNAPLRVRFMLPGDPKKIQVAALVRWVDRRSEATYSMGLEFTDLPDADRARLYGFIDSSLTAS